MDKRSVYLDHQTTTPVLEEALQAMLPYFREAYGSPSSLHRFGLQVREGLKEAKEKLAALINAESWEDLIITSGGTESSNLAIKGFADANHRKGNHIVVSAIEHPSVMNSVEYLTKHGFEVTSVPVNPIGQINPEDVRAAITDKTILVCVHLVNRFLQVFHNGKRFRRRRRIQLLNRKARMHQHPVAHRNVRRQ